MHFSSNTFLAIAALAATTVQAGGAPSIVVTAKSGPNKVTECWPCNPIIAAILKCQRAPASEIQDCMCANQSPNPTPQNHWATASWDCRPCLLSDLTDDNAVFWGHLWQTIYQLSVSCGNRASGGIVYPGPVEGSICAGHEEVNYKACVALREKDEESWAYFGNWEYNPSNGTQVLNLVDPYKPEPQPQPEPELEPVESTSTTTSTEIRTIESESESETSAPASVAEVQSSEGAASATAGATTEANGSSSTITGAGAAATETVVTGAAGKGISHGSAAAVGFAAVAGLAVMLA